MVEKDSVFSSKVKSKGLFSFKEFYKFCYEWMSDEMGLDVSEKKYKEKLSGNEKEIEIEWEGEKKVTDYFKYVVKAEIKITDLQEVEVTKGETKIKTNKGGAEVKISGTLEKDYDGKFERDAVRKFLRGTYEKWIIASKVEEYQGKLAGACDEFLAQVKAYLALEGKR